MKVIELFQNLTKSPETALTWQWSLVRSQSCPPFFPCFFTIFSSQKSGMQTHSRVQWCDEFAGTNYLAKVNEIRRVNPMGRFASFVRSETVLSERLICL